MKYAVLLLLMPFISFGQTQEDYNKLMADFVDYYNTELTEKICTLFPANKDGDCFWKWVKASQDKSSYEEYGKIISFKYVGVDETDPEEVAVFKAIFVNKGVKAISFNIKDRKFATFRFDTSSDEIERMLQKAN